MSDDLEKAEHEQLLSDHSERKSVGGSVASVVALESAGQPVPFGRSMFDEWTRLTGRSPPRKDTDRFEMGRLLEEPLAIRFQRVTGLTVEKIPLLVHPKHAWVTGHMDRIVLDKPGDVELKTVEWDPHGEWSDPALGEPNRVPLLYFLQAIWYNGIPLDTGWEVRAEFERSIFIAAQFGFSKPLRVYRWEPDENIRNIYRAMFEACQRFWEDYVLKDEPPPVKNGNEEAEKRWLKYQYPKPKDDSLIDAPATSVEIAKAYKEAVKKEKEWKTKKEKLGNQLAKMIGNSYGIRATLGSTTIKATWPLVEMPARTLPPTQFRRINVTVKDSNEQYRLAEESEDAGGSGSGE